MDSGDIKKHFKNTNDDINKEDLKDIKGFAANILKFIDDQDDSTKEAISKAFGDDNLNQLKNLSK